MGLYEKVKAQKAARYGLGPREGLWWYRQFESAERDAVITAYLTRCSRGRKLPEGFRDELELWLRELNSPIPGRHHHRCKFWTLPGYASHVGVDKNTLMKRCRELERVAKQLYPEKVEPSRVDVVIPPWDVAMIREQYSEGGSVPDIAKEFGLEPFRVGQLCKDLKDATKAAEAAEAATTPAFEPEPEPEPF